MWREIINRIVTSPRSIVFNAIAAALLFSLLFGLLVSPQWSGEYLTAALMGATLAALIGNFEHIESFKASSSGIEAKTREVVRRAETTLQELQNLAAMMGPLLIDLIVGGGRWGGRGTPADKDAQKKQVLEILRDAGLSQARIDEIALTDRRWVVIDYVGYILSNRLASRLDSKKQREWNNFIEEFSASFDRPEPDEIQAFLERLGLLDDVARELIEDYRHYLATGKHRRPEIWARRGEG